MRCESTGNESEEQHIHEREVGEREREGEPASRSFAISVGRRSFWTGGRYHGRKGNIHLPPPLI
ncbi:hypothetical protein GW17_00039916 [Ensete ventricosum]|nr:hypothetical protein GW17_00039916 [Ensete ventricosum]